MKKRIMGILFVLVALVALCALSVSAADVDFTAGGKQYCQHCKTDVDWLPLTAEVWSGWSKNYDQTAGSHYYLAEETVTGSGTLSIGAGETLCLHLNGNTFAGKSTRPFRVYGTMNLMDHAANEGLLYGMAGSGTTGCTIRVEPSCAFNMYGGKVEMRSGTYNRGGNGGILYLDKNAAFAMYGGAITGGTGENGGNLYIGSGATAQLLGGSITGGTALKIDSTDGYGGNICCGGTMTLGGCTVSGGTAAVLGSDLYFLEAGKLIVKKDFAGETKVGFNAAHLPDPIQGGYLTGDTCEGPFTGKLYVENDAALPTLYGKDGDTKLYITGDAEEDDEVVTPEGTLNLYCQKCKANKDFLPLTGSVTGGWGTNYSEANGTHYYVAEEKVKLAGATTIAAGEELCLHLNGNTLYRNAIRAFNLNGTLSIMDHAANEGVLFAYAEGSSTGGVVRLGAASGELNLYGGTLQMKTGSHANCVSGGVVYIIKGSTFNMYGGTLADGKAKTGGNLYIGENGKFTMTGGTMTGGVAVNTDGTTSTGLGGNIYINSGAQVNISNATLTKGHAQERGGNLVTTATTITLNITDSVISDGSCDKSGGNLYLNNGKIVITGCTITGGKAGASGANIISKVGASASSNYAKLLNCTITNGTSTNYGGNIYVEGNSSGTATLTLGNCTVTGGTCGKSGNNIFIAKTGKLAITKDFAGQASVAFSDSYITEPVRGGMIATAGASCEGPFAGKLYIENDAQLPEAYGKTGDTTLYVKAAAVVKEGGTKTWYDSNADAVAAYDSDTKYLIANSGDLALTGGEYTVDLCGADVNVTGTGSATFMDSANADFATYGTATVTGVTVANKALTTVEGNAYYMVKAGDSYTFHRMGAALTNVSIRPSSSGMYYEGVWNCDDVLKGMIESYGVAVSLKSMPQKNFQKDSTCLYTEYGKDTLVSGGAKTGVIIEDILNAAEEAQGNDTNARKPVYARAYVKLSDGTVIMSDTGAAESLHSVMTRLDQIIKTNNEASRKYLHDAREFYNTWKEKGMGAWEMKTIPVQPRVEDGKLNLLMVGNSFCYYYVEELYELLMENLPEGITEVNIYNVYHSGCSAETHKNKWLANAPYYTLFKTSAAGRVALTSEYAATLEEALALEEDWDFISLQGSLASGASYMRAKETDLHLATAAVAEPVLDRFHDLFPNAQLLWHRTWFFEVGRVSGSTTYTEEMAEPYDSGMQFVCDYMCNEFDKTQPYDLVQVNSGAPWVLVREAEKGKNLLPFGGLCARLGYSAFGDNLAGYTGPTANSGDGYHEGDIGGAQLLNAYSWYGTLTGQDCRESKYRPVYTKDGVSYTLPEELVKIMQDSSYAVVSQMPETVQPAK